MSHVCEEPEPGRGQDVSGQHAQPAGYPRAAQGRGRRHGGARPDRHARHRTRHAGASLFIHLIMID